MADTLLRIRFPVRLPSRANEQHGRRKRKGGKLGAKIALPAEQRAATAAALGWWCPRCQTPAIPSQPSRRWIPVPQHDGQRFCCSDARIDSSPPIIAGPEHPVDVLLVRIGTPLDDDNLQGALKAVRDEVTAQLWRWNDLKRKLGKKPDDSVKWIRWCYEQTTEGRTKGTELCEVVIAAREDCQCFCGELRQAVRRWAEGQYRETGPYGRPHERPLLEALDRLGDKPCGCGRSMLPIRWARGEL